MKLPGVQISWNGKRTDLLPQPSIVFDCVEKIGEPAAAGWSNRLIHGDNLAVMTALLPELAGKFDLIYLDPPFFTGKEWKSKREKATPDVLEETGPSRESAGAGRAEYAEPGLMGSTRGGLNTSGFSDSWNGDLPAYLQWLYDRLLLCHALLSRTGCLYLHLSWHSVHYAKLLMDEIFGVEQFQNEIVWCYREAINSKKRWNRKHDTLLFYSKTETFTFNYDAVREPYAESNIKKYRLRDEKGAYRLMGRGIVSSPLRSKRDLPAEMETLFPELTYRHYLGEGTLPLDYWNIDIENQASALRTGYPTQKPEALLERILLASSNAGDLVGDFCCGSGTTLAVAGRLGRRWIGCDAGESAVSIAAERLRGVGAPFACCRLLATESRGSLDA